MTKKLLILTLSILLTTGLALTAPRNHDGHGEGRQERRLERMIEELNLSRSQAEQIENVLGQAREDGRATHEQLRMLGREIRQALQAEVVDETAVRQRFAEKAALEAEAAIQRSQVHKQMMSVLDDDQRVQLSELREDHRPLRRHGRRR